MKLIEKMKFVSERGEALPLKGHVRLVLEDIRDGRQIVEEGDNLITNAAQSIFAHNWSATADFSKILPLKSSMYGGCMMFQNEITETADNFNVPNELLNPCIAHAGNEAPAISWTERKRGTPVSSEYVETENSIKQVWLWDNTQGVGRISTVCLVPTKFGNMGTTPPDATLDAWTPFAIPNDANLQEAITPTREQAMRFPISIASDGKTGKAIYWTGTDFEEITVRHDWLVHGIMRSINDFTEVQSRTATVRSTTKGNIFEDDNYYYAYEIKNSNSLQIDKISKADFTVVQADLNNISGVSFYTGNQAKVAWNMLVPRFAYDGHFLYLPNSTGNGFIGINPNDASDKLVLDGTVSLILSDYQYGTQRIPTRPIVVSSGFVYGDNYLINGANVYPHALTTIPYSAEDSSRMTLQNSIRHGSAVWVYPMIDSQRGRRSQGPVLLGTVLSSIYNLESPRNKEVTQTMRLEYTITEAT